MGLLRTSIVTFVNLRSHPKLPHLNPTLTPDMNVDSHITLREFSTPIWYPYNSNFAPRALRRENTHSSFELHNFLKSRLRLLTPSIHFISRHVAHTLFLVDVNDCKINPCKNGSCTETGLNSYICHCYTGWTGDICDEGAVYTSVVFGFRNIFSMLIHTYTVPAPTPGRTRTDATAITDGLMTYVTKVNVTKVPFFFP